MLSEDFENIGQRDLKVDDRRKHWNVKKDNNGNSIYCNKVTDDWTAFNFGSPRWSDYSISYRMKFSSSKGGSAETHIRKTIGDGHYRSWIGSNGDIKIRFIKSNSSRRENLIERFVSTKTGEWLDIQLIASGDEITFLVDGEVVASAKDDRVKKGAGMFAVSENSEVCIDDIVVNKM